MTPRLMRVLALLGLAIPLPLLAAIPKTGPDGSRTTPPPVIQVIDFGQRIDVNNLSMVVTNTGSFAFDKLTGNSGLEFPRGSGHTVVFAAGLWMGAQVGGQTRVAISDYSDEYGPGAMIGGVPDDPSRPEYQVYKLNRSYGSPIERDAALAAYNAGAVPHGAPPVAVQPDGTLGILGDQMLWSVCNDADPANHTNRAGSTSPLGIEVQQTTFAFNRVGPLSQTIFIRFKIVNRGPDLLQNAYFGFWFDPDLGQAGDDVVGCNPSRSLGYCYNGDSSDDQYGTAPPVIGVSVLQGAELFPGGPRYGLRSFGSYINGTDPNSSLASYYGLQGRDASGNLPIDPTTGVPTEFMFAGDPTTGAGWIDTSPADKRMLLATGPVDMTPGQEQELLVALIVGSADSRLNSLRQYLCDEDGVRTFAAGGFTGPGPITQPCVPPDVPCERPADYWTLQCGPGAELTALQMESIAQRVDEGSLFFEWGGQDPREGLCAALGGDLSDPKAAAGREFASLVATVAAANLEIRTPGGEGFRIDVDRPVSCPGVSDSTVGDLIRTASLGVEGTYLDLNPAHPLPLAGVNWGGSSFGGGAGAAVDLFGSTLTDPATFPEVEVRFDHGQTQQAYRFLRRELPGGAPPAVGRGYVYAGFQTVPFTCWDTTHNVQLDVAFVEQVATLDDGTILDPAQQPPTYDGTWGPDESTTGGREYLFVLGLPYTGSPDPALTVDGLPINGLLPSTYVLWSRRISASDVIDDGDRFRFSFSVLGSGIDAALLRLASQPIEDPAVRQAYEDIAACLHAINENDGRGPGCTGPVTPVIANAGSDVTVECASSQGTAVQLDGSLSEGVNLSYAWSAQGVSFDNPGAVRPTGTFPFGTSAVQLTVTSGSQSSTDTVLVTIADTTPPTITVALAPDALWPPNHKVAAIHAEVAAQDVRDGSPAIRLLSITSSEPDAGGDPDDVPNDIREAELGTADFDFGLRSERLGQGSGRSYHVCYQATDAGGNSAVACADVSVPHDQSGHAGLVAGTGSPGLAVYGGWGSPIRGIAPATVAVGTDDFHRARAGQSEPAYGDLDRDGREDALFAIEDGLPASPPGILQKLFARWVAEGQGYLAEMAGGPITGVEGPGLPQRFEVGVAANPFRGAALIRYALPRPGRVSVRIFDVAGHQVARLADGWGVAGWHTARFEPGAAQLYLYRVEWEGRALTGKFVVLK